MHPALPLLVAPWLLLGGTSAEKAPAVSSDRQDVEVRYRPLGEGRHLASLTVRYATARNLEVGWQVAWRQFAAQDPIVAGRHVTVGPLWACVARLKSRAAGLRVELNPWLAVSTSFREPQSTIPYRPVEVRMPYGADVSGMVYVSLRFGKALRVSPGASAMTRAALTTRSSEPDHKFWERQTGWRITFPMSFGAQARFRIEGGYLGLWHEGAYFGRDRWDVAMAWRF